ncbi:MAG: TIGR00296 family protein [Candidatus Bathyarchaeota archaeon]|nr:TIGR00296 family protein [Candidatus Bathyarchaeota archaeon]
MSFQLSDDEGKFLVTLARKASQQKIAAGETIQPPKNTPKKLFEFAGVFVTINTFSNGKKNLRGCIGYPHPTHVLVEALIDSAINAAIHDPRFFPISFIELNNLIFEVSVLTPPKIINVNNPLEYPKHITIGQDGLIVERGPLKGLLLPQVPVEWGWSQEEFVSQCCIKAGLSPDSWRNKGIKLYKFQALIFEEETPRGKIKRRPLA